MAARSCIGALARGGQRRRRRAQRNDDDGSETTTPGRSRSSRLVHTLGSNALCIQLRRAENSGMFEDCPTSPPEPARHNCAAWASLQRRSKGANAPPGRRSRTAGAPPGRRSTTARAPLGRWAMSTPLGRRPELAAPRCGIDCGGRRGGAHAKPTGAPCVRHPGVLLRCGALLARALQRAAACCDMPTTHTST